MNAASSMRPNSVPKPALLVGLDAPRQVRAARLPAHAHRQGWIDWLLEFDLETQLRSSEALHKLRQSLPQHAVPAIDVQCTDTHARDEGLRGLKVHGEKSR